MLNELQRMMTKILYVPNADVSGAKATIATQLDQVHKCKLWVNNEGKGHQWR